MKKIWVAGILLAGIARHFMRAHPYKQSLYLLRLFAPSSSRVPNLVNFLLWKLKIFELFLLF